MCPVCEATTFRTATWTTSTGAAWPAFECLACGAVTPQQDLTAHDEPPNTSRIPADQRPTFRPAHLSGTYPLLPRHEDRTTLEALIKVLTHG